MKPCLNPLSRLRRYFFAAGLLSGCGLCCFPHHVLAQSPALPPLSSQPPSANADVVKMIQAGLPESTVVNKIREGAGRWDTSVDALIALKQAGATEAELGALTTVAPRASANNTETASAQVQMLAPAPFMGGEVTYRSGNVVFHISVPTYLGNQDLNFQVVMLAGHLALKLEADAVFAAHSAKKSYLAKDCTDSWGDLLIEHDRVSYSPYIEADCPFQNPFAKWRPVANLTPVEFPLTEIAMESEPWHPDLWDATRFSKNSPWAFNIGGVSIVIKGLKAKASPPPSQKFFDAVLHDFDGTMAALLKAVEVSDPSSQLSAASQYLKPTNNQINWIVQSVNLDAEQRHRSYDLAQASKTKDGGSGFLSFMNGIQGVANMQQAMTQVKLADASHIGAAQLSAAANLGRTEIDAVGSVASPTTALQPTAPIYQAVPTQPQSNAVASTPQKAQSGFTYQVSHGQPESKTVASNTGSVPPAANSQPRANPNPGGVPSGVSTGTAPAANCVYLSDAQPCVPLAQWQQMQANQPIRVPVEVCPKSGFVPGLMRKVSSDVSEGVPCTPGQPIDPSVFASGSSSVSNSSSFGGSSGSSTSGGGNSSGSGVSNTGGPSDPILNDCIGLSYKNDPITGDHLILQNNCSVRAQVYFYASSQVSGGEALDPGEAGNTYAAHDKILAAGGVSIYACPVGDVPRQADGTLAYNGVNNHFLCSRK